MVIIGSSDPVFAQPVSAALRPQKRLESTEYNPSADTVRISEEAQQRFQAEAANNQMLRESYQKEDAGGAAWELSTGLKKESSS